MKQNILVVEDNQLNRELLCDWLEMEGYEVWFAANLESSYKILAKRLPDAVLLDINLGAENGLDLIAWMRQKPALGDIPMIAVTAHALVTDQEQILPAGCKACLSKPINFEGLREQLNHWVQDRTVSRPNS